MMSHLLKEKFIGFENEEKCQLNDSNVISYSIEMLELMKKGYEQMGELNLKYSNEASTSEYEDSIDYEMWLCGV
ncbi:MAG: hypothetical protein ACRDD2_13995 [Sarcina sp.]